MYPPNALKRIFLSGIRPVVFFLPVLFLSYGVFAQTIVPRDPLKKTTIKISPTIPSGSCPINIDQGRLPGHISICGNVKTAGLNEKDGAQYAQEPIEGATVAVYLGASHAQGIPAGWESLTSDPNGTGEIAGKIDGLYMYNITNKGGDFVVAAPRGVGTQGMIFLAFFCGQTIKDLYMLDTSKDLLSMKVSLACPSSVTPATNVPDTNSIPAPPSVTYAIRGSYTSCEVDAKKGQPGDVNENSQTTSLPLYAAGLDDSRLNAEVIQNVTGTCQLSANGVWRVTGEHPTPGGYLEFVKKPVNTPTIIGDEPRYLEVPPKNVLLSRRDLEGFTHSSLGYSLQSISSLNCGVGGCYDVVPPAMEKKERLTVNRDKVFECNTSAFAPLNCKGPGIELSEPTEWTRSYYDADNRDVEIFKTPSTLIKDITLPQYSSFGQTLQEILAAAGIAFTPVNGVDTSASLIAQLQSLMDPTNGILVKFKAASDALSDLSANVDSLFLNFPANFDLPTAINVLANLGSVTTNFFSIATAISDPFVLAIFPGLRDAILPVIAVRDDVVGYVKAISDGMSRLINSPTIENINLFLAEQSDAAISLRSSLIGLVKIIPALVDAVNVALSELPQRIKNLNDAMVALSQINITTVSHDYFPYSSLLNYNILGNFNWHFENRPSNDSYKNVDGSSDCINQEMDRQNTSSRASNPLYIGWYPFKSCYSGVLLAQDTYSTQKALYTTTKNTDKAVKDEANDPVVSKFLMPGEEVGKEVNFTGTIPSSVGKTPKIGQGYWRLGVVNTVCSHGVNDTAGGYPVLAVLGAEGALNATPDWP